MQLYETIILQLTPSPTCIELYVVLWEHNACIAIHFHPIKYAIATISAHQQTIHQETKVQAWYG